MRPFVPIFAATVTSVLVAASACGASRATTTAATSTTTTVPVSSTAFTTSTSVVSVTSSAEGQPHRDVDGAPWVDGVISSTVTTCQGSYLGRRMVYPPTLMVIEAATGRLRWQFCPTSPTNGIGAALAGETVVFTSGILRDDGQIDIGIAGFDAATGETRWQTRRPTGLAVVANEDTIILPPTAVADRDTTAVDAETGRRRWQVSNAVVPTDGARQVSDGRVVVGTADGALIGLNASDGTARWSANGISLGFVTSGGIVGETRTGAVSQIAVVDAATGRVQWKADGVVQIATDRVVVVETVDRTLPPATLPGTTGAPVALPNVVQVRAIADGKVLWTFDRLKAALRLRAFDGQGVPSDRLLLSTDNMGLEVRDARTGDLTWSRGGPFDVVVADDDTLVGLDGGVTAHDAATGRERWRLAIPCISDRVGCTNESSYVQNVALHDGVVALAINDFGGG